jgi:hypothetical protein
LLTTISKLLRIELDGLAVSQETAHPFFAFLHTVDIAAGGRHALVTSSGYDAVFECDLQRGNVIKEWFAWEHGFNPDREGIWLAASRETYEAYLREGKEALLINPDAYDSQGILTAHRTAHPNMAVYDPYDDGHSFLVCIGHKGSIYRVNRDTHRTNKVFEVGAQMPHGLRSFDDGWCLTNTVKGEWWVLKANFQVKEIYSVTDVSPKVPGTEEVEWVQQAVPIGEHHVLFIDANRGLIAVDRKERRYSVYKSDPNWCIQDVLHTFE